MDQKDSDNKPGSGEKERIDKFHEIPRKDGGGETPPRKQDVMDTHKPPSKPGDGGADKKLEGLSSASHDLLFGVRRSIRYHSRRRQFYERVHTVAATLTAFSGSATIVAVLGKFGSPWTVGFALAVAVFSAIDLVCGTNRASRLHDDLARNFLDLEKAIITTYVKGRELPRVEIIMKLADIGGLTVDDLLKTDKPPKEKEMVIIKGKGHLMPLKGDIKIETVNYGNVYNNTTVRPNYKYVYQQGDLTEEQAARIKELVEEIVELEKSSSKNPKSYAAVYNALKKKFRVVFYRKIGEENFPKAEAYLKAWKGRLLKTRTFPENDSELYRKERYRAIFAAAQNQLGLKRVDLDAYIFSEFGVLSIQELDNNQLERLYDKIMGAKKDGGKKKG